MTPRYLKQIQAILTQANHDHNRGLNVHAFFRVDNKDIGKELVQETFLKTWTYLIKGGKIDLMKSFLYHVLNDLVVDHYRKQKTVSLDKLAESGFEPSTDSTGRLFDNLDGKEVMLLINSLPAKYQAVMRMRYVQDLSVTEMSLITGLSKNAIAVHAHRGMEKLKLLYPKDSFLTKKD